MARRVLASAFLALVALALGCSTTQPTAKPAQNAQVTFQSTAPTALLFEVWDASLETVTTFPPPSDRPPETTVQDLGLWCDIATDSSLQTRPSPVYPFRFSVEIDRIRAGTSVIERLSDATFMSTYGSVTAYDDSPPGAPTTNPVSWSRLISQDPETNTTVTLSLAHGRRISTASRDFIEKIKVAPGVYGSKCPYGGPASAAQLGNPGVAGNADFFPVQLNAGDTLIVKARKDTNPSASALFTNGNPTFGSRLLVEGRDAGPSLVGNAFSPVGSQDGISYAFTLR